MPGGPDGGLILTLPVEAGVLHRHPGVNEPLLHMLSSKSKLAGRVSNLIKHCQHAMWLGVL